MTKLCDIQRGTIATVVDFLQLLCTGEIKNAFMGMTFVQKKIFKAFSTNVHTDLMQTNY